ncbi:MAG: hypothetical protein ACKVP2_06775 [Burkholderiales bacterium]
MNFTEPVIAAIIGATATVVTALVQLRVAGKKQAAERASGKPVTKKQSSWLAILALMLASAVGGYVLAQYHAFNEQRENQRLRDEMLARMGELSAAAMRMERAGSQLDGQTSDALAAAERKRGAEGVAAVVNLPPCRGAQVGFSQTSPACAEGDALRASLCATIPPAAVVTEVQMFSRTGEAQQAWVDAKMQLGQEVAGVRFVEAFAERATPDGKEICQPVLYWGSQPGRAARILVKYVP